uniref:Uncharacterized protein n=1 Tax=Felis catus TaxID=9685 RepID=A0ABI7ZNT0_FELCA
MVPESSLAKDQWRICQATLTLSSKATLPLCLVFFCFFLSPRFLEGFDEQDRGGRYHFNLGLSRMVSFTVTPRPFQSLAALAMSSPTYLGDRPVGLSFGARADVAPTPPLVRLRSTSLISSCSGWNLGGRVEAAAAGGTRTGDC